MKTIKYILLAITALSVAVACESYLDRSPESGLSKEDVFSKYDNFKSFFDAVYGGTSKDDPTSPSTWYEYNIKTSYNLYLTQSAFRSTWEALTETADMGRINRQPIKYGQIESNLQWFTTHRVAPILNSMFKDIRICNVALENIGMLTDASEESINDLKGQIFFVRAYCHFSLMRLWGGMPYIDRPLGDDGVWDIPRLSNYETLIKATEDLDSAAFYFNKAGKMRRDPGPGKIGHLNDPDQARPNGVAAIALKARMLLYAASPLSNENGIKDWEAAATACWEAISLAERYEYALLPAAEYKSNFVGAKYTNEQIWAWNYKGSRFLFGRYPDPIAEQCHAQQLHVPDARVSYAEHGRQV